MYKKINQSNMLTLQVCKNYKGNRIFHRELVHDVSRTKFYDYHMLKKTWYSKCFNSLIELGFLNLDNLFSYDTVSHVKDIWKFKLGKNFDLLNILKNNINTLCTTYGKVTPQNFFFFWKFWIFICWKVE